MTCTPSPTTPWPGSGGRANRRAYVSLPRKYRPLMKEKNSPSDAPSGDRSAAASANDAFGESACFARRPLQLAGESRNTRDTSETPPQEHGADGEARTHGRQEHQVPFLEPAAAHGVIQRKRNRGGRGIPEVLDVDDHLVGIDSQLLGGRLNDAAIRLVRDEQIDIGGRQAVAV